MTNFERFGLGLSNAIRVERQHHGWLFSGTPKIEGNAARIHLKVEYVKKERMVCVFFRDKTQWVSCSEYAFFPGHSTQYCTMCNAEFVVEESFVHSICLDGRMCPQIVSLFIDFCEDWFERANEAAFLDAGITTWRCIWKFRQDSLPFPQRTNASGHKIQFPREICEKIVHYIEADAENRSAKRLKIN